MDDLLKTKLRWRCRRGMLELDLILNQFLDEQADSLSEREEALFQALLESPDPDLYAWLMGYQEPESEELEEIVYKIRGHQ